MRHRLKTAFTVALTLLLVCLLGAQKFLVPIDMGSNKITNLGTPSAGTDAVHLTYATNASNLASGTVATARLGSGSASSSTFLRGDSTWAAAGLSNFTESTGTYSSQTYVSLVPNNAASNVHVVLSAKGTGYLSAHTPDGTSTGGNQRGTYATDLQRHRNAAAKVASGGDSAIGGGVSNTSSGTAATVGGGDSNTASGNQAAVGGGEGNVASSTAAVVAGGRSNTSSNTHAFCGGGQGNAASGDKSTISGGYENQASGDYSTIPGGAYGSTRSLYGMLAHGSGQFATRGDAQAGKYILRWITTDATPKVLTTNQTTAGTTNQIVLPNNSAYSIDGVLVAHRTDSVGTYSRYTFKALVSRGANAAATTVQYSSVTTDFETDSTFDATITADTTNGCPAFTVTGASGKTVRWVLVVSTTEVTS